MRHPAPAENAAHPCAAPCGFYPPSPPLRRGPAGQRHRKGRGERESKSKAGAEWGLVHWRAWLCMRLLDARVKRSCRAGAVRAAARDDPAAGTTFYASRLCRRITRCFSRTRAPIQMRRRGMERAAARDDPAAGTTFYASRLCRRITRCFSRTRAPIQMRRRGMERAAARDDPAAGTTFYASRLCRRITRCFSRARAPIQMRRRGMERAAARDDLSLERRSRRRGCVAASRAVSRGPAPRSR